MTGQSGRSEKRPVVRSQKIDHCSIAEIDQCSFGLLYGSGIGSLFGFGFGPLLYCSIAKPCFGRATSRATVSSMARVVDLNMPGVVLSSVISPLEVVLL